jgi:hypothetical protein
MRLAMNLQQPFVPTLLLLSFWCPSAALGQAGVPAEPPADERTGPAGEPPMLERAPQPTTPPAGPQVGQATPEPPAPEPAPAVTSAAEPAAMPAPEPPADPEAEPEPDYPIFDPQVRLIMGLERRKVHLVTGQIAEDNRQPFFLEQARTELDIELNDDLSGSFSAELAADPVIRDAYINVKLEREFQIQAGHFKRPISRIETTSTGKLPFRDRGLFNRILLRRGEWGNRSLGVMLWGKFKKPDFHWYAAVMNSAPSMDVPDLEQQRGFDALGRVEYQPTEWLSIALNGGHKIMEPYVGGPNLDLNAFGGDIRVRTGGFYMVLESIAAQNPRPTPPPPQAGRTPFAWVVMGYATYDIALADWVTFQPTLVGEWTDTDGDISQDEAVRALGGLNFLFFDEALRVMPQVEVVRPLGEVTLRSHVKRETYYLMLSTEF